MATKAAQVETKDDLEAYLKENPDAYVYVSIGNGYFALRKGEALILVRTMRANRLTYPNWLFETVGESIYIDTNA